MKTYQGARTIDGTRVSVEGAALPERYDIERFTNSGFEWTYVGNEPRQLALALLADHLGDDAKALALSDAFMRAVIADLDNDWTMTGAEIDAALARLASG